MDFAARDTRELEMAVRVTKADGRQISVVPERDLERFGFGISPIAAIEKYRKLRTQEAVEDGREPWDDVVIQVVSDQEAGYVLRSYTIAMSVSFNATRPEVALRRVGQYLIDLANGVEDADGLYGEGLEVTATELQG